MDLPLDIGVFSTIIENNYIYVDKTKFIYDLYRPGGKYFLSRPRRFGKSLLLRTMKDLFKCNKDLFEGLYIHDKWDWTRTFPVIELDLGNVTRNSPDVLKNSLDSYVMRIAEDYQIELISNDFAGKFSELIKKIYESTSKKVVVLVDEYDKPIIDNIEDHDIADGNHKVLNTFYTVLKSNEEFINFIFLTGVTKFSKTSIFSGLNNITDITVDSKFANICGYTQDDLEKCFSKHLGDFSDFYNISCDELLDLIKDWYNGYSWDGKNRVYNPYSILALFAKGEFGNFWFETGTPSFLMDFVKNNNDINVLFESNPIISGDFPNFTLKDLDFTTLLLQTGYLTIKSKKVNVGELTSYGLGIPNREVRESLFKSIIKEYSNLDDGNFNVLSKKFLSSILDFDNDSLQDVLDALMASIPAIQYGKVKEDIREANYHILFLSWLRLMGFFAIGEIPSSKGTVDIVLKKDNLVIVCELKYGLDKPLEDLATEAIEQIKEKEYYKPYLDYDVGLLAAAFGEREVKSLIEPLNI